MHDDVVRVAARNIKRGDALLNLGMVTATGRLGVWVVVEYSTERPSLILGTIRKVVETVIFHEVDEVWAENV